MTVWSTTGGFSGKVSDPSQWELMCSCRKPVSVRQLVELRLRKPIRLRSGEAVSLYVHSQRQDDLGLVYGNQRSSVTHVDKYMEILPGVAHLCPEPFASWHPWGSWRLHRQFVGIVSFRTRYLLWNPEVHHRFSPGFKKLVLLLLMARPCRDCPLSWLSEDCLYYILNMCTFDAVLISRAANHWSRNPDESPLQGLTRRLSRVWRTSVTLSRGLIGI